jgi:hypothetical protein
MACSSAGPEEEENSKWSVSSSIILIGNKLYNQIDNSSCKCKNEMSDQNDRKKEF